MAKTVATSSAGLPSEIPEYLKDRAAVAMRGIEADDFATPRLLLLQALSPQVEEGLGKAGNLFHSGAEREIGQEALVTPVFITKAFTLWRPRPEGGVLARSVDGITWDRVGSWQVKLRNGRTVQWEIKTKNVADSGLLDFGSSEPGNPDSQPAATLSYNLAVVIHDYMDCGPAVLQLQRSQIRNARKLLGRIRNCPHPYYALKIPIEVFKDQSDEGSFYNLRYRKFGFVSREEFAEFEKLNHVFEEKGVHVRAGDESSGDEMRRTDDLDDSIPF
jgi:hypothetical protein